LSLAAYLEGRWVSVQGYLALYHQDGRFNKVLLTEEVYLPVENFGTPPTATNSIRVTFQRGVDVGALTGKQDLRVSGELQIRPGDSEHRFWVVNAVPGRVARSPMPASSRTSPHSTVSYSLLEKARGGGVSPEIQALHGRWVTLTGHLWVPYPTGGDVRDFIVAKNPWDGCCLGVPPTAFDSVEVRLREGAALANPMAEFATVSGRFVVDRREQLGEIVGLYRILDAVPGTVAEGAVEGGGWGGVLLPALILAAFLGLLTLGALRRGGGAGRRGA